MLQMARKKLCVIWEADKAPNLKHCEIKTYKFVLKSTQNSKVSWDYLSANLWGAYKPNAAGGKNHTV